MKTPPAPSEDLLFSPPPQEPARTGSAKPVQPNPPGQLASSSDSGMSDERNADSVLFKLDTLSAMQKQAPKGGAPQQMARLAAPAPQSEAGSGLIDLNTLSAGSAAAEEAADAAASGSDVTSSAALSRSSLLSSSSMVGAAVPTPGSTPSLAPAPAPSRTPMIVLSVLALIALVAAVTAIVLRG